MRIGIDCRIYGTKNTGIGRYTQNLVEELLKQDKENEYVLFVRKDFLTQNSKLKKPATRNSFGIQNHNLKLKTTIVEVPHYSLKEQFLMPYIIYREQLDLMHFPHFNVPVFYRGKYIVTIHDLIKHSSRGRETTTKAGWLYWLKYIGYKFVFKKAVKRASKILVPSNFVKEELIKEYKLNPVKVVVTYEGVDTKLKTQNSKSLLRGIPSEYKTTTQNSKLLEKYEIKKPYLLYVGSVYPHKNIERLIEAMKILRNTTLDMNLVVVCARNVFSERLRNKIVQMEAREFVNLAGFVPDEDLAVLYQEAEAFVFPTLSEGFGLPGLEAMSVGCPVICSDIPVLKEIYKDSAIYFNPLNPSDIVEKIKDFLSDKSLQVKLSQSGPRLVESYSWAKMSKETLSIYQSV